MKQQRRKRTYPTEPVHARVESLTHDGRGIAHVEGQPVFIHGALPGEAIDFIYTDRRRDYAEGRLVTVHTAAAERVEPRCPSFGVCGGCSFQHVADSAQIRLKQELLVEQFRRIGGLDEVPLAPPLTGPCWGYRDKARLGVKFVAKKGRVLVGFRERSSPFIADLSWCPVLHPAVGERLHELSALIAELSVRDRLPQIEVAVGEHRAALVFRILEDLTEADEGALREFGHQYNFDIYTQRQGPDSIRLLYPERVEFLSYRLDAQGIEFHFQPTDFTQVNIEINRQMVNRVLEWLDPRPGERVLDLFCGIGNFSLPLATRAGQVVGIEGSADAVRRARENAIANRLSNVEFHEADLFEDLANAAWASTAYDKILLDPSRAGAERVVETMARWRAGRVVYVSCNPSTLARDAAILIRKGGYRLVRTGVMDMFPQTAHVESMAWFEK